MNTIYAKGRTFTMPTRDDVLNLEVGDLAPYSFGESIVTSIYARGDNINGRAYVCYYAALGNSGATISGSITENELHRGLHESSQFTSAELDAIEYQFRRS